MVPASSPFTFLSSSHTPQEARPSSALAERNKGDRKPKGRRFTQSVHQQTNYSQKQFNADRMWKNSKSIEELENRLTSRWGTDLNKWTAQDIDEINDDEEEEWFDDPTTEVAGETSVFRARPVRDPWADHEDGGSSSTKPHHKSFLSLEDDDDATARLVRRAQKNQERLEKRKDAQPKHDDDDDDVTDFDNYQAPSKQQNRKGKNGLQVDDLISPIPVGGQGTFRKTEARSPHQPFFFSPRAPEKSEEESEASEPEKPKRKREKTPGIPILDEDGNPFLLTLDQVERDFKDSLEAEYGMVADEIAGEDRVHSLSQSDEAKGWQDLGITSPILLKNLEAVGCEQPLNVQQKTCPSVLNGEDVLVGTYTGSGKTLAFLVPLIQRLVNEEKNQDGNLKVLIVAPGRELASQIVTVARELLEGSDFSVMMAIGGTTFSRNLDQIRKRKPDILVGTPGRIAELVVGRPGDRGGRLKVGGVQSLVLDEFDALLEYKPHRDPTNAIIQCLKQRHGDRLQSVLCSATASDMLDSPKLEKYLRHDYSVAMADKDDLLVTSTDGATDENGQVTRVSRTVIHGVVHIPHKRFALETLRRILHTDPLPQQILIFAENSRKVDIVVEKLKHMGIIAAPLHGGRGSDKQDRAEVSKALREGYVGIVVATELAARGLDAPLLTHVINLDLPTDSSHYSHRAGRAGRGGRPGVVINITTGPKERNVPRKFADKLGINLYTVEPRNGKLNIVDPDSVDLD